MHGSGSQNLCYIRISCGVRIYKQQRTTRIYVPPKRFCIPHCYWLSPTAHTIHWPKAYPTTSWIAWVNNEEYRWSLQTKVFLRSAGLLECGAASGIGHPRQSLKTWSILLSTSGLTLRVFVHIHIVDPLRNILCLRSACLCVIRLTGQSRLMSEVTYVRKHMDSTD